MFFFIWVYYHWGIMWVEKGCLPCSLPWVRAGFFSSNLVELVVLKRGECRGLISGQRLGLRSLFGLGDQLFLLLQPCLPVVLLRQMPLPPGGGSPWVHVDCRVASGCPDIHLRVDCVLGHLDCHQHISSACPSPRGRHFWSLDSWISC